MVSSVPWVSLWWNYHQEYEDSKHSAGSTQEESDYEQILAPDLVLLVVELLPCFGKVAATEAVCIELDQVVCQNLELFTHLAFFRLECFRFDYRSKLLVDSVVFDGEEVLGKLLHDLSERKLVNVSVRVEPSNLHPNLLEHSFPIDHVIELINYF